MQYRNVTGTGMTDIGRVRSTNQDSFLIDESLGLFMVADGMGGHAGGEIASRLCVESMQATISSSNLLSRTDLSHPCPEILSKLSIAVNKASSDIYEHSLEDPSLRGMGTTATAVKIIDNYAYTAHVGDSRLYLIRRGFIFQMTYDHSLVSEQVRAGILTPEEAEVHHLKNVITRSVGYQEEEDVDTALLKIEKNDLLLLCSDGLHGKISDAEISREISSHGKQAVNTLVRLANDRGGEDNITAVIVEIQP